jgi:hypothetical protein
LRLGGWAAGPDLTDGRPGRRRGLARLAGLAGLEGLEGLAGPDGLAGLAGPDGLDGLEGLAGLGRPRLVWNRLARTALDTSALAEPVRDHPALRV